MTIHIETIRKTLVENSTISLDGCHELNRAPANLTGHRRITIGGKRGYGHRFAAMVEFGEKYDKQAMVCHLCDNPACCNPEHVYMGDAYSNKLDER